MSRPSEGGNSSFSGLLWYDLERGGGESLKSLPNLSSSSGAIDARYVLPICVNLNPNYNQTDNAGPQTPMLKLTPSNADNLTPAEWLKERSSKNKRNIWKREIITRLKVTLTWHVLQYLHVQEDGHHCHHKIPFQTNGRLHPCCGRKLHKVRSLSRNAQRR